MNFSFSEKQIIADLDKKAEDSKHVCNERKIDFRFFTGNSNYAIYNNILVLDYR